MEKDSPLKGKAKNRGKKTVDVDAIIAKDMLIDDSKCISLDKLDTFRRSVHPGDVFSVWTNKSHSCNEPDGYRYIDVTVQSVHPFVAVTNRGAFQYIDLYMAKRKH